MGNERKIRLIQVAKEFNVGINTITDFLHKKGIKSDGSPNTLVDPETYAVLEKEFGSNRSAASARNSIRERISLKQTTITLEEAKKQERKEEKEVVIKSNVISVKDEPTAARASTPRYWPTMMVSTVLYICWKKLPSRMGKKKKSSCFQITPSVMRCDGNSPCIKSASRRIYWDDSTIETADCPLIFSGSAHRVQQVENRKIEITPGLLSRQPPRVIPLRSWYLTSVG